MSSTPKVKAVLFDVGGVLVSSPFKVISEFEHKYDIPDGWINFAISQSSPNGAWQRLERNELCFDDAFFREFDEDMQNVQVWQAFKEKRGSATSLRSSADPTRLSDHTSLARETDASEHQAREKGDRSGDQQQPSLSKLAKDTAIGDPVSLEAEDVVQQSPGRDVHESEAGTDSINDMNPVTSVNNAPSPPHVDGEELLWNIVSASREPDPYFLRALEELLKQHHRPILGALSNDFKIPRDHSLRKSEHGKDVPPNIRGYLASKLDLYIASSDVGLRKPSKPMYKLAIDRLNEHSRGIGGSGDIQLENVVFIDDIGENLKVASDMGMRTIKVRQGKTWRAVKELEVYLDLRLMDEKTRRAKL